MESLKVDPKHVVEDFKEGTCLTSADDRRHLIMAGRSSAYVSSSRRKRIHGN